MDEILSIAFQVGALVAAGVVVLSAAMVRSELARLTQREISLATLPEQASGWRASANVVERRATA
jgi:hypothetical protein